MGYIRLAHHSYHRAFCNQKSLKNGQNAILTTFEPIGNKLTVALNSTIRYQSVKS